MYNEQVIYHVYNQSVNYEPLFREDRNYHLFLQKVEKHLLPFANIFCYCLMPDHFHLMLKPSADGCALSNAGRYLRLGEEPNTPKYQQNLSHGLQIMLSSYTQKVNKTYGRRGSLIKAKTKAKPAYAPFYPDANQLEGDQPFTRFLPYLQICFHYIHDNPVKAKLVRDPMEWPWSSALDYAGWRDTRICNYELTDHLLGIRRSKSLVPPSDGKPSDRLRSDG